jgi:hypothetical protein
MTVRRSVLLVLGLTAVLVGGALWWLATAPTKSRPAETAVAGLPDTTRLRWSAEGVAVIEARASASALSALGYAHGMERAWTALLWRQTALGTLSGWFGHGLVPLDRHARTLGFERHARQAYNRLPDSTKAHLRAYSRGLNAALRTDRVQESAPLVLLGVESEAWQPWHTLLVGRLLAWIATPPLSPDRDHPEAVREFADRDRRLRRWLHLHGWSRSVAWAARPPDGGDSTASVLFQRHILGASAPPVVQEVHWQRPGASTTWATLPGTLLFPTGTTRQRAWASLLQSRSRLARVPLDSSRRRNWHERIDPAGGDERLERVDRLRGALLLATESGASSPPPPDTTRETPPDTAWVVRWPGLSRRADVEAWLHRAGLSGSDAPSFDLFRPDGLTLHATGDWRVRGRPAVVESTEATVLVGQTPWARAQARALDDRRAAADTLAPSAWSTSDSSAWAAGLFPHVRATVQQRDDVGAPLRAALPYLRNWDFQYSPTSIGALLFDQWMREYRAELGHVPTRADSGAYFGRYRQRTALKRALDTLATRFGTDVRRWRWEEGVSDRRFFPVWSADSLVAADLGDLRTTRYAPIERTAQGHPSTLSSGPALVDPPVVAPSPDTWTGWMRPGTPMTVRRYRYEPEALLARSRVRTDRPPARVLSLPATGPTTLLVPARP